MPEQMWQVTCSPTCGFQVRSHSKDELVTVVQNHGKRIHQLDMALDQVQGMTQPA